MSKAFKKYLLMFGIVSFISIFSGCSDENSGKLDNPIQVSNWGPRSTKAGKGFSIQSNGDSAIWFEFRGPGNANNLEVWFGEQKLSGVAIIPDKGGSAQVPAILLTNPKQVKVYLLYTTSNKKIELGVFDIL